MSLASSRIILLVLGLLFVGYLSQGVVVGLLGLTVTKELEEHECNIERKIAKRKNRPVEEKCRLPEQKESDNE